MAQLWTDKYAPLTEGAFIGNPETLGTAKEWAGRWEKGKRETPLLLYGQTGAGKTALAYLIAHLHSWDIFEFNASDFRTKEAVEKIAGAAACNASFSGRLRLVLIDEVDGILGSYDRGGMAAVLQLLKSATNPVILTANDIYADRGLAPLRSACKLLEFKRINYLSIAKRLCEIANANGIKYDAEAIKELAKNSSGDFRAALLDMQTLAMHGDVGMEAVRELGYREREEKIFKILQDIFKGSELSAIRRARASSGIGNDLLERWIEENIPRQYTHPEDIAAAFERLSRADVFEGRIVRRQHFGFLRYSSELMTSGVALSRSHDYHGYTAYQFPGLLSKLSRSKPLRELKKALSKKIGSFTHSSARSTMAEDLPFIKMIFTNHALAVEMAARLNLEEDEVAYLLETKPETKKVQRTMEEADALRRQWLGGKRSPATALKVASREEALYAATASSGAKKDAKESEDAQSSEGHMQTRLFG